MVMIVDSNEKNKNITNILAENGVPFEIQHLEVADYVWNDIAVERKAITDFVSSVSSNHIFDQLEDLVYNLSLGASRVILVMHGDLSEVEWRFLKYWDVPVFYRHIGEILSHYPNVNFFWLENEEAFATLLSAMYHQSFSRKVERLPFVKKTKDYRVNVLMATKFFSIAQAKRILRGNTLRQIFNMDVSEMIKIKGFGKVGMGKFIKFRGSK